MKKPLKIQLITLIIAIILSIGSLVIKGQEYQQEVGRTMEIADMVDQGWPLQFKSTVIANYDGREKIMKNLNEGALRYANEFNAIYFILNVLILFLLVRGVIIVFQELFYKLKKKRK